MFPDIACECDRCQDGRYGTGPPYRGVDAGERIAGRRRRLLDAGLDLLGAAGKDPAELTVRAICGQAALGVRYFYESFNDKDDFVGAVFDSVIADIAATTQAAVAAASPAEQARAAMANVVRTISADPASDASFQRRAVQHRDRAQARGVDGLVRRPALRP